jgi:hypothetical protein
MNRLSHPGVIAALVSLHAVFSDRVRDVGPDRPRHLHILVGGLTVAGPASCKTTSIKRHCHLGIDCQRSVEVCNRAVELAELEISETAGIECPSVIRS